MRLASAFLRVSGRHFQRNKVSGAGQHAQATLLHGRQQRGLDRNLRLRFTARVRQNRPTQPGLLAFVLFGYGSLLSSHALHGPAPRERIQAGRELTQTEHNVDRGVYFDCLAVEHRGLVAPLFYRIHRRLHQKWRPRNVL